MPSFDISYLRSAIVRRAFDGAVCNSLLEALDELQAANEAIETSVDMLGACPSGQCIVARSVLITYQKRLSSHKERLSWTHI